MAAPMEKTFLCLFRRKFYSLFMTSQRQMGFISNLRERFGGKAQPDSTNVIRLEELEEEEEIEEDSRRKRRNIEEVKPYAPLSCIEVEEKIQKNVDLIYGPTDNWRQMQLDSRLKKYELLTSLIEEFDHDIPSVELNDINSVNDLIKYYKVEVRDTSAYVDMSKLDLPKNLHINLEPIRFDKETDKIHSGKTAFPDSKTLVTSVKYRRKYKPSDDDSDSIRGRPVGIARWKD